MVFSFHKNVNWIEKQIESVIEKVSSTDELITFLTSLLQTLYNQYLSGSDYLLCDCPDCHHHLHCHGCYTRYVMICGVKVPLQIRRIRCPACGKTHAVLPPWLIPYVQTPLPDIINLIIRQKKSIHYNQERYRFLRTFHDRWAGFIESQSLLLNLSIHKHCLLFGRSPFMSSFRSQFRISFQSSNIAFVYS